MPKKVAACLVVIIFLLALACGVTIAAGIYTNGFESVNTYYVKANDKVIKNNATVDLKGDTVTFYLTGAGFKAADWGDFTVSISANPNAEIAYEIDDKEYTLGNADLTQSFNVKKDNGSFTIGEGAYELESVLKSVYGANLKITNYKKGVAPYKLTVTAESGKKVEFYLAGEIELPDFDLELEPPELVFGE